LTKARIDEKEVSVANDSALKLVKRAEEEKKRLTSFIFNKKIILFVKNEKAVEMSNIGAIKYESVEGAELKDLKKIDISDIVNGGYCVQVYPQIEKTFCLIFINNDECGLTQVTIDENENIISPLRKFSNNGFYICLFRKHKDDIYFHDGSYRISKLNRKLSVVKTVNSGYDTSFLSVNDNNVYTFSNHLLIYNRNLVFLKQVGQSINPTGAFFLPIGIKQFESHKGKYYWLNETKLQILREDNGQLVNSVTINADSFIIDSSQVVLVNNATKEINYFNADGYLVDQKPIDNYRPDLKFSLTKNAKYFFYSDTALFVSNE